MDLEALRTITIVSAAIGQTAFVLLYLTFRWWETFLGKALFFKGLAFAALLDVAVAGRLMDWAYEDEIFIGLYIVLTLGVWAQLFAFWHTKQAGRMDSRERV